MLQVSLNFEEVTLSPLPRATQPQKKIQHLSQGFILILIFLSTTQETI